MGVSKIVYSPFLILQIISPVGQVLQITSIPLEVDFETTSKTGFNYL
jgi:hypothetical protein